VSLLEFNFNLVFYRFLRYFYQTPPAVAPEIGSHFYTKLLLSGPDAVARWAPNLAVYEHFILPIHLKYVMIIEVLSSFYDVLVRIIGPLVW
jgi:hypothetical protein